MRHRDWIVPPTNGLPGAALEVQRRGGLLVPVIAVRGLSPTAMVGAATVAKVSVSLRFDGAVGTDLECGNSGTSYTCAPDATSLRSLAAQLPQARVLSASVTLAIPGMVAAPPLDRTLDLAGTEAALIRLQAAGATAETLPALPGLELQGFLDRIMKRLGFPGGTAGAIMKLLQYSH